MIIRKKISVEHNITTGYWYLINSRFVYKTKSFDKIKGKVSVELYHMRK